MLIFAGTGTINGKVTFAGQSTDTTVVAHTIESAWLVKVSFTCLPDSLIVVKSKSYQAGLFASTLAPLSQSKVIKSLRKHGLVVSFTTSKPKWRGWSVVISKNTSAASSFSYTLSTRLSSSIKEPNTFGITAPNSIPAGIGTVKVAPVAYIQLGTTPMVTLARLPLLFAK